MMLNSTLALLMVSTFVIGAPVSRNTGARAVAIRDLSVVEESGKVAPSASPDRGRRGRRGRRDSRMENLALNSGFELLAPQIGIER